MYTKRIFDILTSLIGIVVLFPLLLLISLLILMDSKGDIFYLQSRVGRKKVLFDLLKFRTMHLNADKKGLLTIGSHDMRITRLGYWLRKYKIDELPQLYNILIGDMSFVGPRPEVYKYVEMYTPLQQRVLSVKPGITDWASINFFEENELLAKSDDPENFYIKEIIPLKIQQSLNYIDKHNLWIDMTIIFLTLKRVVTK